MNREEQSSSIRVIVHGRVQGVGFRYWTARQAADFALVGTVRNLADGTVEVVVSGSDDVLDRFVGCLHRGPVAAKVVKVDTTPVDPISLNDFKILR